jgi:glycosyltransferase involved in cell wall biosynthesis
MPRLSAIVHTQNDQHRIARLLESLRPCNEVLVIDHSSTDETVTVAKHHGALVKQGIPGVEHGTYVLDLRHHWVLSVLPSEALSEALEAALFEWRELSEDECDQLGYAIRIREETGDGWRFLSPEMRLANRARINWTSAIPPAAPGVPALDGDLLRFLEPVPGDRSGLLADALE